MNSFFKKVYGPETIDVHFSSSEEFVNSLRDSSSSGRYLTCSDYAYAESVRRDLSDIYGEENVHSVYGMSFICNLDYPIKTF